jgi:galactose mutarotase-like enzyme
MLILENETYQVKINSKGAELKSVFHKNFKKEILYDGNSTFWNRSSPILFPIVGRLKNNAFHVKNDTFNLNQHGFARDQEFSILHSNETNIIFSLKSNDTTLMFYPFEFELLISYSIDKNKLTTNYKVINTGIEDLTFSIGAHPGFICPLFDEESFDDYYLEFEYEEDFTRYLLNCDTGLFTGKTEKVPFFKKNIALNYEYFKKDAIVFKNLKSTWINLKSNKSRYCLRFNLKDFPYFGIWTKENAPFICLEPWCGLADSENSTGNFLKKEGINILNKNQQFERSFSFEIA